MKIFIFIILLSSLVEFNLSETCKYSISCSQDNNQQYCATKKHTESPNIFEIKLKKCSSTSCNLYDTLLGDEEKNVSCSNFPNNLYRNPSYPGGFCESDINCLSGICINNVCTDSLLNEKCHNHENCPLNTACINGKCSSYLKDNSNCTDSYQCQFDSFCNQKTKKCQKLFSIENGVDISGYVPEGERMENLCKSGGYITEKINETITKKCESLTNINYSCNDLCKYTKSNGEIFTSEEKCMCGYNKYRSKYCIIGNGEPLYKEHFENKKKFLKNKEYTKFCHTLERDFDEICLELVNTDLSVPFRNYIKEYNNKKILALQHHRLQESDECVKEVLFNYDTKDIFSLNQSCPVFSCNYEKDFCFYGINPLNDDGKGITISLNSNYCHEKEYCSLPNGNGFINASVIMDNTKIEGQCKIFRYDINLKRYPGEECNFNSDCLLENSTCNNGRCTGSGMDENCTNTSECLSGLYCNKDINKCKKQKVEGETCSEGWDCMNYLGCFKGRCIKFGTLKKGIKITQNLAPFPGDDKRNYLCYTGELDESGSFCVDNDYDDHWLKHSIKEIDKKGYIKCEYGEKCVYNNGKNKFEKNCECGYNNMGQGYCPLPSSRNLDAWKERIKFIGNSANNECHSLSRFNCYLKNDYQYHSEKRKHEANTINAHLFYNSIDCAYKVFANQNYNKYSFYFIILLFMILF